MPDSLRPDAAQPPGCSLLGGVALTLVLWMMPPSAAAAPNPLTPLYAAAQIAEVDRARVAPDFTLHDLAGDDVTLSDFRGKLVVLNFWATWCGPCVKEMPALEAVGRELAEQGLIVLAVSMDTRPRAHVETFAAGLGWQLPVLLDPLNEVGDRYGIRTLPTTYLVGRDGSFKGRTFGAIEWDQPDAVALLRALLAAPTPQP